jgi:nanoRNase/pAp phosphatase (c-di-AMP/oligoRNAs hydrolase)
VTLVPTVLVALKTVTLVIGGLITLVAWRAFRQTRAKPIGAIALGFGLVTAGAILAGGAHQAAGFNLELVLLIESTLTVIGFGTILYSLYADW